MGNVCICKSRRNRSCAAHTGYVNKAGGLTPKQCVLLADRSARLDYSELLRKNGKPCWFIRSGMQGPFLHEGLFSTPRAAWAAAYAEFRAQMQARCGKVAA